MTASDDQSAAFRVTCTLPVGWTAEDLAEDLRGLLGEFRPDAQLGWEVTELDSPALRAEQDRVIAAIVDKVRRSLDGRTVTLTYADRDDSLRPEQVQVLLKGENPYESSEFTFLEDAESEQRHQSATEELREILSGAEYALLEEDDEALDEARSLVFDADGSDLITDILKNTGPMLLRYDLGVDVWTDYTSSDEDREQMKAEIVEALTLPEDHPVRARLDELLTDGQSGRLWVIWSAYPEHVVDEVWPLQKPRMVGDVPAATITWNRPPGDAGARLLILDSLNGSGHDVPLGGPLTVPFDADNLTTDDRSGGHGWNDVAGLVRSAYEATIDVEMLTWTSAGTGEPADQVADSVRHGGWYTVGPQVREATCRHCGRRIVSGDGGWIDPEAAGDDNVWRETCDSNDTFTAEHEPGTTRDDRWSVTYCWNENDTTHELDLGQDWRGETVAKRQAEEHERSHNPTGREKGLGGH